MMETYGGLKAKLRLLVSLGLLLGVCFAASAAFNQDKSKQGWNTFISDVYGFKFDYPSTWEVGVASHAPDTHCPLITLAPEWSSNTNAWGDSGRAIAILREPNLGPDEAFRSDMEFAWSSEITGSMSDFYLDYADGGDRSLGTTRTFYGYFENINAHHGVIRKRFGSQSLEMYVQIASSTPEHVSEATSTLQRIGQSIRLTNRFTGLKNGCRSSE